MELVCIILVLIGGVLLGSIAMAAFLLVYVNLPEESTDEPTLVGRTQTRRGQP